MKKQPHPPLNVWEIGAAAALLLLGVFMVVQGLDYPFGTLVRIGPGFFPVLTGGALIALSAAAMYASRHLATARPDLPLRPLACISSGLILFGLMIDRAGLVPATFVLVFLAAAGESDMRWIRTIAIAAIMSLTGWLIFGLAFRLPISPFWW